jgi:hypothetical protein
MPFHTLIFSIRQKALRSTQSSEFPFAAAISRYCTATFTSFLTPRPDTKHGSNPHMPNPSPCPIIGRSVSFLHISAKVDIPRGNHPARASRKIPNCFCVIRPNASSASVQKPRSTQEPELPLAAARSRNRNASWASFFTETTSWWDLG